MKFSSEIQKADMGLFIRSVDSKKLYWYLYFRQPGHEMVFCREKPGKQGLIYVLSHFFQFHLGEFRRT